MKVKEKILSVLTAGIVVIMSVFWTMPQALNRADLRVNADQPQAYDTPALMIGSASGNAGDTVAIPISVYCNDSLASLDTIIAWNDEALDSSLAFIGTAKNIGSFVSDVGDDYCLIMVSHDDDGELGVADGIVAYLNFTIPQDAPKGTVYELYFDAVDVFSDMEGNDLRDTLNKYTATITVGDSPAAVTTSVTTTAAPKTTTTAPVTTVSAAPPVTAETTVSSTVKEYDAGCALMLSSGKGKPGSKVSLDLVALCGNDMEALDIVMSWDDPQLMLASVQTNDIYGSIDHVEADTFCSLMAVGEHIADGVVCKLDFQIPQDAVPGTVYEVSFYRVNSVYSSDGVEHADKTMLQSGKICVTDKSGNIVTTAPTQENKPPTSTTVASANSLSLSKTKLDMIVGDSLHLKVNGSSSTVKWSSSDSETVSVNSKGAITALKKGSALIIAYVEGSYLTCEVNVEPDESDESFVVGDANDDGKVNVRDAAHIAKCLAQGRSSTLPQSADFNEDGKINVRDAAAIAKYLATGKK